MKASTREWVAKAEEDFAVALTLARPRKKPLWAPEPGFAREINLRGAEQAEGFLKEMARAGRFFCG